jgi:hypothetical protein
VKLSGRSVNREAIVVMAADRDLKGDVAGHDAVAVEFRADGYRDHRNSS